MTLISGILTSKLAQTVSRFPYAILSAFAAAILISTMLSEPRGSFFGPNPLKNYIFLLTCFSTCSTFVAVVCEALKVRFIYQFALQAVLLAAIWLGVVIATEPVSRIFLSIGFLLVLLGAPALSKMEDKASWSFMRNVLVGHFASFIVFLMLLLCVWQILFMGRFEAVLSFGRTPLFAFSAFFAYIFGLSFISKTDPTAPEVTPGPTYTLVVNYILIPGFLIVLSLQLFNLLRFGLPSDMMDTSRRSNWWAGSRMGHWSLLAGISYFKLMFCAAILFCLAAPLQATHAVSRYFRRFYFILALVLAALSFSEVLRMNPGSSYIYYAWLGVGLSAIFGILYSNVHRIRFNSAYVPLLIGVGLLLVVIGPFSPERNLMKVEQAKLEQVMKEIGVLGENGVVTPLQPDQPQPSRQQLRELRERLNYFSSRQDKLPDYMKNIVVEGPRSYQWIGKVMSQLNLEAPDVSMLPTMSYNSSNPINIGNKVIATDGFAAITTFNLNSSQRVTGAQERKFGNIELKPSDNGLTVFVADAEVAQIDLLAALPEPATVQPNVRSERGPSIIREITHEGYKIRLVVNRFEYKKFAERNVVQQVNGLLFFSPYEPAPVSSPTEIPQ